MATRFGSILKAAGPRAPGAALAAALLLAAVPAHALRVVTWNFFNYPGYNLAARQPNFRMVMANINADILTYGWAVDGFHVADGMEFNYTTDSGSSGKREIQAVVTDGEFTQLIAVIGLSGYSAQEV